MTRHWPRDLQDRSSYRCAYIVLYKTMPLIPLDIALHKTVPLIPWTFPYKTVVLIPWTLDIVL